MVTQTPTIKRHPIAGAIWGLVMGIGVSLILIDRAIVAFGTLPPYIIPVLFLVLGVVWAYVAPARGPKAPPGGLVDVDRAATETPWAQAEPAPPAAPGAPEAPAAPDVAEAAAETAADSLDEPAPPAAPEEPPPPPAAPA